MNNPTHIVCGHCDSINRIPNDRLKSNPSCGKCKQAIFNGYPITLNQQNFDLNISRNEIAVLVDFWAPWCGPCLSMAPAYEIAAQH